MAEKNNTVPLEYDKTARKTVDGEKINYGILSGNRKIVFIKSGADGKIKGKNNKYPKIAHRIRERMGATVICADNPYVEDEKYEEHKATDKSMIMKVAEEAGFSAFEVYFIGTSDGGYHNLLLAKDMPQTVKLLGINPSLISFEDFAEKICALKKVEKILVYGTEDEAYDCVSLLRELNCNNLELITVEGANHEFKGMQDEFIALTDML